MISFFEENSQIFGRSVAEGIEFVRDRLADSLQLPGPEATARTLFVEAPKLFALVRLDSIESPGKGSAPLGSVQSAFHIREFCCEGKSG